jgi:hypothetical protein
VIFIIMKNLNITEEEKQRILESHSSNNSIQEDKGDEDWKEQGPRGMRAARSWSTFVPSEREDEIASKLFGKYGADIPPFVIRYLRKLPRKVLTKRLMDLNLLDLD